MTGEDETSFDSAKAEMFEAIGHPNRIKILQALDQGALGFAELKKRVGTESSGHLAFHLGKLGQLVTMEPDGRYALTGEGREALRMIQTVREKGPRHSSRGRFGARPMVALLVIVIVVFAAVAAVQQLEIGNLLARPPGTVRLDGRSFWYATFPLQELSLNANTSILFDGINFTFVPAHVVSATPLRSTVMLVSPPAHPNGTIVQSGRVMTFRIVFYPDVQVRFPDGKTETLYTEHIVARNGITTISFLPPAWPWFSTHVNPQVAISENSTALTVYISTGR